MGVVTVAAGYSALLGLNCPGEYRCLGLTTGLGAIIKSKFLMLATIISTV